MADQKVPGELKAMLVARRSLDPGRAAGLNLHTSLPKGIDGAPGLDPLDFIELPVGIEDRVGLVMDEQGDLAPHFESLATLVRYIIPRLDRG